MNRKNRREFLKESLSIGAASVTIPATAATPGVVRATHRAVSANDKIVIGLMGAGGRGNALLEMYAARPDVEIAWICDVNPAKFARPVKTVEANKNKAPRVDGDFRRMLDDKSVDAVINATPAHWHALAAVWACQAGKDMYVEKPASHNVREGRKMVEAARKYKRVIQVGLQNRSCDHGWSARDYIKSGAIGTVHLARVNNMILRNRVDKGPDQPPPEGMNWDMYLGPAPMRPYNPIYHNFMFWDLDGGNLTDDGIHQLDLARYALDLGYPRAVTHTGGNYHFKDAGQTPDTILATYEYDGLSLIFESIWWGKYMRKTPEEIRNGTPEMFPDWYPFNGTRIEIYGSDGYMLLGRHGGGWQAFDRKGRLLKKDKMTHIKTQHAHIGNFLDCVRSRALPRADVAEAHITTTMCHLGNISYRVGNRRLEFDPRTETIPGDADASRYMNRTWRKPWVMPDKV
ncbi:MAG: Gfo/Idh/MocA family oxidoreductase [Blastocatellia bacterium]